MADKVIGVGIKVKLEDPVPKNSLREGESFIVHVGARETAAGDLLLHTHGMLGRAAYHWPP